MGRDRDSALRAVRDRYEVPIWTLIRELDVTLSDLGKVKHAELTDPRAVGSVLNSALPDAAIAANLGDKGLRVVYCKEGQSHKLEGEVTVGEERRAVSFEFHLSGPQGGTSKAAHQFVGYDIERAPKFPGFEVPAPPSLLFFVACHLGGTGASVARVFLKFADKLDQRKLELHRDRPSETAGLTETAPLNGPVGTKLKLKKKAGEEDQYGSAADQRGDAASRSKST